MWGLMKNDSPVYQKVERVFVAENQDAKGLLLKSHLKRHRQFASAITYRSVYYSIKNFLDFQKNRNEPVEVWGGGSVLIFPEHRRTVLLEEYDLRVQKRNASNRKGNKTNTENASKSARLRVSGILENNGFSLSRRIGFRND